MHNDERQQRDEAADVPRQSDDAAEADAPVAGPPPSDVEAYAGPPDATEPVVPVAAAHSVPATEPGESTLCPRCGTENRPGIAFCRNCGQRLVAAGAPTTVARPAPPEGTQACARCGTHNRAGVAFCQNCGANLRVAEEGYVPPPVAPAEAAGAGVAHEARTEPAGRAFLGPVVLLIGAIFTGVAWVLPFAIGASSLFEGAYGPGGYGIAFWSGYEGLDTLAEQAYFGFAAPAPVLVALLVLLAIGGIAKRVPGPVQVIGLVVALVWAIGLVVLFFVVEVLGSGGTDLLGVMRQLTPGGIIFMLASLIAIIGVLTRFGRG
ncbi:MAG TPA: zinc-ribbon domain-containing protein [Candidatus Limnocylindria bacterium]|nr:zinc-ribbon domain-containing protein [Candidatus Limnocylindria bacterium]